MTQFITNTFQIFYGDEPISLIKATELLNRLSKENEQLKSEKDKIKTILNGNELENEL